MQEIAISTKTPMQVIKNNNNLHMHTIIIDSDEVMLMTNTHFTQDKTNIWYLNIGCNNHMTGNND